MVALLVFMRYQIIIMVPSHHISILMPEDMLLCLRSTNNRFNQILKINLTSRGFRANISRYLITQLIFERRFLNL